MKEWKDTNLERKTQLNGYNSYIAPEPYFEYQVDGFEYKYDQNQFNKLKKTIGKQPQPKPIPKHGFLLIC